MSRYFRAGAVKAALTAYSKARGGDDLADDIERIIKDL